MSQSTANMYHHLSKTFQPTNQIVRRSKKHHRLFVLFKITVLNAYEAHKHGCIIYYIC